MLTVAAANGSCRIFSGCYGGAWNACLGQQQCQYANLLCSYDAVLLVRAMMEHLGAMLPASPSAATESTVPKPKEKAKAKNKCQGHGHC